MHLKVVRKLFICLPISSSSPTKLEIISWRSLRGSRASTILENMSKREGLVSYGPDFADLYRRAAEFADKILHGANVGDIPVEQPAKLFFAVNLITAKALGLDVPPKLLALADEVIE